MKNQYEELVIKGARLSIFTYLVLASIKLFVAYWMHSLALKADGLNNLTDIISSVVIFIGLQLAHRPADSDHHYGHSKFEPIASFVTSLIMFTVGLDIIKSGIERFIQHEFITPNLTSAWISLATSGFLYISYRYIHFLAKKSRSLGLKTNTKDMFNDIIVSIGTSIAIIGTSLGLTHADLVMSIIVGLLIMKTAYDIFRESTFTLSDGFDVEELERYRSLILKHPKVRAVPIIKGRICGSQIYVDVTIEIDGNLSVIYSHNITQEVERILAYQCMVREVDVHVEPYFE